MLHAPWGNTDYPEVLDAESPQYHPTSGPLKNQCHLSSLLQFLLSVTFFIPYFPSTFSIVLGCYCGVAHGFCYSLMLLGCCER